MSNVRFGQYLDGAGCLTLPTKLGDVDLGPSGLLNLLEVHLGLVGLWPSSADRAVRYLTALRQAMSPGRFYAASLAADELGTSAELLQWRDSLYLDGWDGNPAPSFGPRLADIAAVEAFVGPDLQSSVGERLRRVENRLSHRRVPIKAICVVDPRDSFPIAWQRVLDQLPTQYEPARPYADGTSVLADLQRGLSAMLAGNAIQNQLWRDDGSVRVVRAETRLLAGRWLADEMQRAPGTQLVLAESQGELLDHILESAGLARHGFAQASAFRPSLQVLPLALSLLWEPLDIYSALEFLTHPLCPIRRYARERFAARMSERPGLERSSYSGVLDDIQLHFDELGEKGVEEIARIDSWLFQPRYKPEEGALISDVAGRVEALKDVFAGRIGTAEPQVQPAFIAGHRQCQAVSTALRQFLANGQSRISISQLRKLVVQATSIGSTNPTRIAELGCAAFSDSAGGVIDPVDTVYWWQLSMPSMPKPAPWTRTEVRQLAEAGILVQSMSGRLAAATGAWLRPIMAARQSITLILPNEAEEVHPVWHLLKQQISGLPIQTLESLLTAEPGTTSLIPVAHKALPQQRRWWTLEAGTIPSTMERSSFSSLDQYLNNPFQWVLSYQAKLKPSRIHSIPDEFTLSGIVAHQVVQDLFERHDALSIPQAALSHWVEGHLDGLLKGQAAVFLMPGQRAAERRLRDAVISAVADITEHLRRAGAKTVTAEREFKNGRYKGGSLIGNVDLVVTFETGEQAVVDMKWGGVKKYPDKLKTNRHLQLVIYGGLLQQEDGSWPRYAYYILKDTKLLAHDREVFSSATICSPEQFLSLPDLWARFETLWAWRQAQLAAGQIEVALESIETDVRSTPPADSFPLEVLSKDYNPFVNLAGWGVNS